MKLYTGEVLVREPESFAYPPNSSPGNSVLGVGQHRTRADGELEFLVARSSVGGVTQRWEPASRLLAPLSPVWVRYCLEKAVGGSFFEGWGINPDNWNIPEPAGEDDELD